MEEIWHHLKSLESRYYNSLRPLGGARFHPPTVSITRDQNRDNSSRLALGHCLAWELLKDNPRVRLQRGLRNPPVIPLWPAYVGFPKKLGGPHNKHYNILGSILRSPYFGKLPYSPLRTHKGSYTSCKRN